LGGRVGVLSSQEGRHRQPDSRSDDAIKKRYILFSMFLILSVVFYASIHPSGHSEGYSHF